MTAPGLHLRAARRRMLADMAGIAVSAIGFGFVFGLAAFGLWARLRRRDDGDGAEQEVVEEE